MEQVTERMPGKRVLVHGLIYFGSVFADFMNGSEWQFRYFPDKGMRNLAAICRHLWSADLIYQLGGRLTQGRFLRTARQFGKTKVIMHWLGSDTLDEFRQSGWATADPWVLRQIHHWAESEWMADEVRSLGAPCKVVPFPSVRIPSEPTPLPDQFRVLVYVPTLERRELYGLDQIVEVAAELPEVQFNLVGLLDGPLPNPPQNLRVHGRIPELTEFYRQSAVIWRPARHDGVSWMVLEALGHGRHVLWSYPFPGCVRVENAAGACEEITRLYRLHREQKLRPNQAGIEFIANSGYHPNAMRVASCARFAEVLDS